MIGRDTGRFAVGTPKRRIAERRAVIAAHLELAIDAVVASLESGWIDEAHSPLGAHRHVDAVCRRIVAQRTGESSGPLEAAIVDGRHLLTIDALADEYFGSTSRRESALTTLGRRRALNDNGGRA